MSMKLDSEIVLSNTGQILKTSLFDFLKDTCHIWFNLRPGQ